MFASPTSGGSRANPYMRQNDAHNLAAERNFRRHNTPTLCFSFMLKHIKAIDILKLPIYFNNFIY